MPRLNVLGGSRRGSVLDLESEPTVIGRSKDCDLVLLDATVSRRHARIAVRENGYYLEDLGSQNGTFLNGQSVTQPTRLSHNDSIQLFDVALAFDELDTPLESTAAPILRVAAQQRKSLAETVAQVDIPTVSSEWVSVNAESKLQAVLELSRGLEDAIEIDDVQTRLLDALHRIFASIDRACLFHVDHHTGRLQLAAFRGDDAASDPAATIAPLTWDLVDNALSQHRAILVSDGHAARSAHASIHVPAALSAMCAPLMATTQSPLGALYVGTSNSDHDFTYEDLDVLVCVSLLASRAVEQATLHSARYRAVLDHAADAIITVGEDGFIESVNPAVHRQLGFEPAELIGESISLILPECSGEPLLAGPEISGKLWPSHREMVARKKDGSLFPVNIALGRFDLRGRRHFTATLRDITHQKREEEQLQRTKAKLEEEVERRTELIRLQQEVAVISNEAESVQDAFAKVMEKLSEFLGWSMGDAYLCEVNDATRFARLDLERSLSRRPITRNSSRPNGMDVSLRERVIATAEPSWSGMTEQDSRNDALPPSTASLAFPVLLGRRVVGVLVFHATDCVPPSRTQLKVLAHVGTQLGRIVERHFLQRQLVDAVWKQQKQFGQELHDTLGQELTGIGMFARALQERLAAAGNAEAQSGSELVAMIQQAKQTARDLAKNLQPVEIDAFGLPAALEELARSVRKRTALDCSFSGVGVIALNDNEVATHLYRIAQEAVNNAAKHANANRIHITLADSGKSYRLDVRDDGGGIPDERGDAAGMGLRIMKYRARTIGARLRIERANPGTSVSCEFSPEVK